MNRAESSRVERAAIALITIISGAEVESSAIATANNENPRINPRTLWALFAFLLSFGVYLSNSANGKARYATPISALISRPERIPAISWWAGSMLKGRAPNLRISISG